MTPELEKVRDEIREYAKEAGLDFFEVIFEVLDWHQMNVVASYGGFPNRYPHWRFGMEYEQISKTYAYGLTKIYEMVINNDPCYAYLLHSNNFVDQKMVMAHVYGHSDFFKNNVFFSTTHRKMIDQMGNHRTKVMMMINRYGLEAVEGFIDLCLSLENLIDFRQVGLPGRKPRPEPADEEEGIEIKKFASKDYMDRYLNPQEFLDEQKKKVEEERKVKKFPDHPERDLFSFLGEHAPLEKWQRDLLWMIREEVYYFAPQAMTKIMNEGWAAYHHSKIMTQKALRDDEVIDYADHHSGTVASHPGTLNPYKIGMELLRRIEERWDKGQFGPEYEDCQTMTERSHWDRKLRLGKEKIFEVRRLYNDVSFLDTFLDEKFCEDQRLFTYQYNPATKVYEIVDRDFQKVKSKLLQKLTNLGHPQIAVVDGDAFHRGELTLKHEHEGIDLRIDWAWDVLKNIQKIWKKPVHLETILDGVPKALSLDGEEKKEQRLV